MKICEREDIRRTALGYYYSLCTVDFSNLCQHYKKKKDIKTNDNDDNEDEISLAKLLLINQFMWQINLAEPEFIVILRCNYQCCSKLYF